MSRYPTSSQKYKLTEVEGRLVGSTREDVEKLLDEEKGSVEDLLMNLGKLYKLPNACDQHLRDFQSASFQPDRGIRVLANDLRAAFF